jgi:hypothetical protein
MDFVEIVMLMTCHFVSVIFSGIFLHIRVTHLYCTDSYLLICGVVAPAHVSVRLP